MSASNSPCNVARTSGRVFRRTRRWALLGGAFVGCAVSAAARHGGSIEAYANLSLEELMHVTVTSVSKKEESLNDAAAAIFIVTRDDILRSGATTIADSLRAVPGLNVASMNSSQWAISARGLNGVLANKLLVLVDGRSVYSPLFGGVYWDLQQLLLEDVDRIEVIRGPGATLWGTNAVNGVINVVTRSAKDTQGTLLYGGGGNVHQALAGARYGGRTGENTYYRVFSTYQMKDNFAAPEGGSARDAWNAWHGGFRVDHYPAADIHATWQLDGTSLDLDDGDSEAYNINTLGRWSREISADSNVEFQAYYDRTVRDEARERTYNAIGTFDLSLQHRLELGDRNELIWGGGYRSVSTKLRETGSTIRVRDGSFDRDHFSAFVQNEFQIVPDRFVFTAGTKVEHNDITDFEVQPSVRASFFPSETQTVWAAVSRALRAPSDIEARDIVHVPIAPPVPGPGGDPYLPVLEGRRDVESEVLWAFELGYRVHPTKRIIVDIAAFYNVYDNIIWVGDPDRFDPGTPFGTAVHPWSNTIRGETYGGEVFVAYSATEELRLSVAYSLLFAQLESSSSFGAETMERSAPRHQVALRSGYDLSRRTTLNGQLRFVDEIIGVPSYVTADLNLTYRTSGHFEVSLVGQNLLESRHREQGDQPLLAAAEVPRGFYGKLTWRF